MFPVIKQELLVEWNIKCSLKKYTESCCLCVPTLLIFSSCFLWFVTFWTLKWKAVQRALIILDTHTLRAILICLMSFITSVSSIFAFFLSIYSPISPWCPRQETCNRLSTSWGTLAGKLSEVKFMAATAWNLSCCCHMGKD